MPNRPLLLVALIALSCGQGQPAAERLELFPLTQVRLTESPFLRAQTANRSYVLAMDPTRLEAPYLREAGLETTAPPYPNWESTGLGGHIGGHYLSALSLLWASTGDTNVRERLERMVRDLHRAQIANGNGYLGGVPDGMAAWDSVAAGLIDAQSFSLNGRWVPWYNLHKVYAGLRDAYQVAGVEEARGMLIALSDWALRLTEGLTDDQMQTMLLAEQGGMNEVLADVADMTGDEKYLALADRFSDRRLLVPLVAGVDSLTGMHANTQIPKVIGFKRIADVAARLGVAGYEEWDAAARFFWQTVVGHRTVAIGGNSVGEHFNPTDDFSGMVTRREGPETCNTYNMLRLTSLLFQTAPSGELMDYYERALYNHILSTQNPESGGLAYFTSLRPGHYRMYSQPGEAMWCCVGSGIESQSKYGQLIYAHSGRDLYVNLFIPSTLDWAEEGIRITQTGRFPDEETVTIRVDASSEFALKVRRPGWVLPGEMTVAVNGTPVEAKAGMDGTIRLERRWSPGDVVTLTLPMHTTLERMPDGSDWYAVLHGPIVLAAAVDPFPGEKLGFLADDSRFGHVANGEMCPPEAAPVLVGDPSEFLARMVPVAGEPLTFRAPARLGGVDAEMTLVPFFRLHETRYAVYFERADADE